MAVLVDAVLSQLELVQSERVGPLSGDQRRFLGSAERQGRRLRRLVEDFRLLVEDESEWSRVDLNDVVGRAVGAVMGAAVARAKPVELRTAERAAIVTDALRVERTVTWLLEYALQAAPPSLPIIVSVDVSCVEIAYIGDEQPNAGHVSLALADALAGELDAAVSSDVSESGVVRLALALPPAGIAAAA